MPLLRALAFVSTLGPGNPAADCEGVPATKAARAVANDNRVAAGTLTGGVLTVRLVAREAAWHPDGTRGCGLRVNAFAEEGKPARIPGPLIRVPVGTEVRVILRNALDDAVHIRGLLERPSGWLVLPSARAQLAMDSTAVEIAKGGTREIRFRANVPGNFYYWGIRSATDTARGSGRFRPDLGATDDGQLVGALIVDPEGRSPAIASSSSPTPASYRILARGMASAYDSVLSASRQETVVSGFMAPNRTMTMEWVPEKEAGQLALPLPLPGAHVGGAARRSSVRPGDRRVERCTQRSRRRCHGGTDRRDRGAPG